MISGIQIDKNGAIYVTVPRWKSGVPATLNMINQVNYTLQPYLSYSIQREGVSGDLQNAKSIYIDSKSRMWIMEVGRRNYLISDTNTHVAGQAGVWIIDMDPAIENIDIDNVSICTTFLLPISSLYVRIASSIIVHVFGVRLIQFSSFHISIIRLQMSLYYLQMVL